MSTTETNICNRALGRLGQERILSLDDTGAGARACQLHFEGTRDEVLRSHRWNFATKRTALSRLAEAPAFGWLYQYTLPADFIRALEVNGTEDGKGRPWVVEGGNLMTNEGAVNLVYICRETNVQKWDALFQEALTLKLAMKLATVLRGSSSQVADFGEEYTRLTAPLARRIDANEGRERKPLRPYRSDFVAQRNSGGLGGGFGGGGGTTSITGPIGPEGPAGPAGDDANIPVWVSALTSISINEDDELEIIKSGVTYWIPLNRR